MTTDRLVIGESGDYRDPAVRLLNLLAVNSIAPLHESDDSGVLAVKGGIDGVKGPRLRHRRPRHGWIHDGPWLRARRRGRRRRGARAQSVIGLWHFGGARPVHEWYGVVRRRAKPPYTFGESVVPRVTLITRKSYGGASR